MHKLESPKKGVLPGCLNQCGRPTLRVGGISGSSPDKRGMEEGKLFALCSLDDACLTSLLLLTDFTMLLL